jgi:hypothetical protein
MTYRDQVAATPLEVVCREVLAPLCNNQLARDILLNVRYVDDVIAGDLDSKDLMIALAEIKRVMLLHGFSFKKIFTNGLYHKELNPDGSSKDDDFSADDRQEEIFHHIWDLMFTRKVEVSI